MSNGQLTSKIIHLAIIVWFCIWVEGKKNKRSRTCTGTKEVLYLEGNVCFSFENAKKSWADANIMCAKNGGSLIIIDSQNVSHFITQEFSTFPGRGNHKDYWIGLARNSTSTNFYWSTGSALDWENWESATQTSSSGAKCASASVALSHQWQEDGCKTKKSYMCQLQATVTIQTTTVSVLATWAQWSACSTTCGPGTRSRFKPCSQVSFATCNAVNQHEGCQEQPCTVIADDVWSTWEGWSTCSITCGHGTKTRFRTCNQTTGGAMCTGSSKDIKGCQESSCNANGPTAARWSDWSEWSTCSVTCNRGTKTRVRTCSGSSTGRGKNKGCKGKDTKNRVCGNKRCTDKKKKKKVAGIFQSRSKDLGIHGFEIARLETNSLMSCAMGCVQDDLCRSFNYQYRSDDKLHQCALNSVDKYDNPQAVTAMKDYTLYDIESLFASD